MGRTPFLISGDGPGYEYKGLAIRSDFLTLSGTMGLYFHSTIDPYYVGIPYDAALFSDTSIFGGHADGSVDPRALGLRNPYGGSCTFRVYNAWASITEYERVAMKWVSNVATFSTEAAGTGVKRDIQFDSANRAAYDSAPSAATIRDILISFGLMAAS